MNIEKALCELKKKIYSKKQKNPPLEILHSNEYNLAWICLY